MNNHRDMTLGELYDARERLCDEIRAALNKFTEQTNIGVEDIDIRPFYVQEKYPPVAYNVTVEIKLP